MPAGDLETPFSTAGEDDVQLGARVELAADGSALVTSVGESRRTREATVVRLDLTDPTSSPEVVRPAASPSDIGPFGYGITGTGDVVLAQDGEILLDVATDGSTLVRTAPGRTVVRVPAA